MERAVAVLMLADQVAIRLRSVGGLGLDRPEVVGFPQDVVVVPQRAADVHAVVALHQPFFIRLVDRAPGIGDDLTAGEFDPDEMVLGIPGGRGDVAGRLFHRPAIATRVVSIGRDARERFRLQEPVIRIIRRRDHPVDQIFNHRPIPGRVVCERGAITIGPAAVFKSICVVEDSDTATRRYNFSTAIFRRWAVRSGHTCRLS